MLGRLRHQLVLQGFDLLVGRDQPRLQAGGLLANRPLFNNELAAGQFAGGFRLGDRLAIAVPQGQIKTDSKAKTGIAILAAQRWSDFQIRILAPDLGLQGRLGRFQPRLRQPDPRMGRQLCRIDLGQGRRSRLILGGDDRRRWGQTDQRQQGQPIFAQACHQTLPFQPPRLPFQTENPEIDQRKLAARLQFLKLAAGSIQPFQKGLGGPDLVALVEQANPGLFDLGRHLPFSRHHRQAVGRRHPGRRLFFQAGNAGQRDGETQTRPQNPGFGNALEDPQGLGIEFRILPPAGFTGERHAFGMFQSLEVEFGIEGQRQDLGLFEGQGQTASGGGRRGFLPLPQFQIQIDRMRRVAFAAGQQDRTGYEIEKMGLHGKPLLTGIAGTK